MKKYKVALTEKDYKEFKEFLKEQKENNLKKGNKNEEIHS